jgi:hypothetical protein
MPWIPAFAGMTENLVFCGLVEHSALIEHRHREKAKRRRDLSFLDSVAGLKAFLSFPHSLA